MLSISLVWIERVSEIRSGLRCVRRERKLQLISRFVKVTDCQGEVTCTVLYFTAPYCTIVDYRVMHCTSLYSTVQRCTAWGALQ